MPWPDRPQCDECNSWLQQYYIDVPLLQSQIKSLEDQVTVLTKENDRLQANDKRQKTTGSIVLKNVEATIAIVNSKLSWLNRIPTTKVCYFNIDFRMIWFVLN